MMRRADMRATIFSTMNDMHSPFQCSNPETKASEESVDARRPATRAEHGLKLPPVGRLRAIQAHPDVLGGGAERPRRPVRMQTWPSVALSAYSIECPPEVILPVEM